ncbi:hydrolase [Bifidobacterium sp. DSM 109958]|uniref:Hydrolase n=1 Tax=Bifidobacterium moraviense TaxID=2675323 RepID=A0A7Y0F312_9BIFI|nr:zinc-dependent metalloprotease [Bifidobacterium sp. DSM 109958]NMN00137.1 hydrolase [Bifidobacterium sp. DSM 109958]
MEENEIRQWLIECFGPVEGEMAWQQFAQLPQPVRDQILSQGKSGLPKPSEVQSLIQALSAGGLNSMADMRRTVDEGPINVKLARSIALGKVNETGAQAMVSAQDGQAARRALSEANLWLDSVCEMNPPSGEAQVLTRAGWVEGTIDAWADFAAPVAQSMSDALASVISERLGGMFDGGEISGMFAGPVPIPIPDSMKDPGQLMRLLGNTSFAMQLGQAAGALSTEVRGSFDQGIALLRTPAGGLIPQNIDEYADSLDLPRGEVMAFLALQEAAHARLFASVPWLMPRFEALIGKYARGISIDLDAMEQQLREAQDMNPESIADAVNLTKVGLTDTPEQREALNALETLLATVEGWVDCVTWRAGMAHIPHIEQLREMLRRERAVGGPAERTFESLLGLDLHPKRQREASAMWERVTAAEGAEARDAKWSHPDLLPALEQPAGASGEASAASGTGDGANGAAGDANLGADAGTGAVNGGTMNGTTMNSTVDWDAELSKLLGEDGDGTDGPADGSADAGDGDPAETPDVGTPNA